MIIKPEKRLCAKQFWLHILIIVFILIMTVPAATAFRYLNEGMEAPEISSSSYLDGKSVSLKEISEGRFVIIFFWASWSPRSLQQFKDMVDLQEKFKDDPISVLAINVDSKSLSDQQEKNVTEIIENLNPGFPVVIDSDLKIFYKYGTIAVPSTAVIDSSGIIRYSPSGYSLSTRDFIYDSIESFLGLKEFDESPLFQKYVPSKKARAYYNLAFNLYSLEIYEKAITNLNMAISYDSLFSLPHILLGEILMQLDSTDQALNEFETAFQLDTTSVPALAKWGEALLKIDKTVEALEKLEYAITLDQNYTPALQDYGLALALNGQVDSSLIYLLNAKDLNPRNLETHFYLGKVYKIAENYSEAVKSYQTALELLYSDE